MDQDFIRTLTAKRRHLLITANDEETIANLRQACISSNLHVCLIGERLPMLANLSVMENIALGPMYHEHISLEECRDRLDSQIEILGLTSLLNLRREALSRPQRMKAQLLRCLANGASFVLLESPPRSDCEVLHRALGVLDTSISLWVCCLSTEQDVYSSMGYPTIDLGTVS